jgi:uncharacterized membrane protein YdjX (TVP38/TMEM64 family)
MVDSSDRASRPLLGYISRQNGWRLVLPLVAVLVLTAGIVIQVIWPGQISLIIQRVTVTLQNAGSFGVIGFVLAQISIAASGVLPASLLGLAAGAVYGVVNGFVLAASSSLLGAYLAFRLSRSFFRPLIERYLARRPRLANLDAKLAAERWRLVCLLRVSPIMPFAVTSYSLGLSRISDRDYMIGTLAALPALLGYVCLGYLAHQGVAAQAEGAGVLRWTVICFGGVATVLLTWRIGALIRKAL